jgi:hypothetical protein
MNDSFFPHAATVLKTDVTVTPLPTSQQHQHHRKRQQQQQQQAATPDGKTNDPMSMSLSMSLSMSTGSCSPFQSSSKKRCLQQHHDISYSGGRNGSSGSSKSMHETPSIGERDPFVQSQVGSHDVMWQCQPQLLLYHPPSSSPQAVQLQIQIPAHAHVRQPSVWESIGSNNDDYQYDDERMELSMSEENAEFSNQTLSSQRSHLLLHPPPSPQQQQQQQLPRANHYIHDDELYDLFLEQQELENEIDPCPYDADVDPSTNISGGIMSNQSHNEEQEMYHYLVQQQQNYQEENTHATQQQHQQYQLLQQQEEELIEDYYNNTQYCQR